jgi:hypothetical protein
MVSLFIFSAPLLVIRGSPPEHPSRPKEKTRAIQLSLDPSNAQRTPDPSLAAVKRAATLSQRFLLAFSAPKVIR